MTKLLKHWEGSVRGTLEYALGGEGRKADGRAGEGADEPTVISCHLS